MESPLNEGVWMSRRLESKRINGAFAALLELHHGALRVEAVQCRVATKLPGLFDGLQSVASGRSGRTHAVWAVDHKDGFERSAFTNLRWLADQDARRVLSGNGVNNNFYALSTQQVVGRLRLQDLKRQGLLIERRQALFALGKKTTSFCVGAGVRVGIGAARLVAKFSAELA